jgi:hypothetical protein
VVVLVGSSTDGGHHGCATVATQAVFEQPDATRQDATEMQTKDCTSMSTYGNAAMDTLENGKLLSIDCVPWNLIKRHDPNLAPLSWPLVSAS